MAFVLRRILVTIPILLLVMLMVFSLIHLIPGDPATVILGQEATNAAKVAMRHRLGLDRPLPAQFLSYLWNVLHGNLGNSLADGTPVSREILQRLPVTIELSVGAFLVALVIAIPIGILSASRRGTVADVAGTIVAFAGMSVPSFWLALLFILFFSVSHQWLPASGFTPLNQDVVANFKGMILPVVATGIREAAVLMRMMRSSLIEVLSQEYIRTARAKGLRGWVVVLKHAVRNALIPVVTSSGLLIAGLLGGVVITEQIFQLPGFGRMILDAVLARDFVTVQGAVLVAASFVILVNLIVDLAYGVLDPRISVR